MLGRHDVVVGLEPAGQAEAPVEHARRHESRGRVAAPAERLGQRGDLGGKRAQPVVAQAVLGRDEARQQRGVRGQRQGDGTFNEITATRKKLRKKLRSGDTVIVTVESPEASGRVSNRYVFTRP